MSDDGEILMGRWDCDACGTRGILGDAYACTSCGAPRPDDVRFYLPDDAERVTDAAGIAAAEAGPDWQCAFCDTWNPATVGACKACGASVADSERKQREREFAPSEVPRTSADVEPPRSAPTRPAPVRSGPVVRPMRPAVPKAVIVGVVVFLLASLGACLLFAKIRSDRIKARNAAVAAQRVVVAEAKRAYEEASAPLLAASSKLERAQLALNDAQRELAQARAALAKTEGTLGHLRGAPEGQVIEHRWAVRIGVERCEAQAGEGWTHPRDAFEVSSEQRVHHHERVLDRVETRYREESYRAQEGFDTETYTERVASGTRQVPDGHTITDLGNGRFKKTPKYRTETVYKTVTKTRQVPRYVRKTRQVPYEEEIYRQDPVHKPWFSYSTWRWDPARPLTLRGSGQTVKDPPGTPPPDAPPARGALRQTARKVIFAVVIGYPEGEPSEQTLERGRWAELVDGDAVIHLPPQVLTLAERDRRIADLDVRRVDQEAAIPPLAERIPPLEEPLPALRAALPPLEEQARPARERLEREREELARLQRDRP